MQQVNWKNANYIIVITYQQLYISCMSCSMKCIQIVLELDVDHVLGRCQVRVSLLDACKACKYNYIEQAAGCISDSALID